MQSAVLLPTASGIASNGRPVSPAAYSTIPQSAA